MDTKICRTCGLEKPLDAFRKGGKDNHPDYRSPTCKPCINARQNLLNRQQRPQRRLVEQRYRSKHPEKVQAWSKKAAAKEKDRYHTDEDFRQKTKTRTNAYGKSHRAIMNAAISRWKKANRPNVNASRRIGRQRRLATDPNYREQLREGLRRHYRAHPEEYLAKSSKRRALIAGASIVESIDHETIFERDRWICQLCFKRVTPEDASIDHVIPVIDGGNHTYQNLVTAHLFCNQSKGARRVPQQQRLFG